MKKLTSLLATVLMVLGLSAQSATTSPGTGHWVVVDSGYQVETYTTGKTTTPLYFYNTSTSEKITGIKRSEETKKQIGTTRKAKGLTNTWTGVERPEQSELMKDPSRNKGAEYMREVMTCPHCGRTANGPNYKRWHGDNCKAKK